jgi:hypothetical protein
VTKQPVMKMKRRITISGLLLTRGTEMREIDERSC